MTRGAASIGLGLRGGRYGRGIEAGYDSAVAIREVTADALKAAFSACGGAVDSEGRRSVRRASRHSGTLAAVEGAQS
jgi:hypothetical protein